MPSETPAPETPAAKTSAPETPQRLTFRDDPGARRSFWIAAALTVGIVAWMASGFVLPAEEEALTTARPLEAEPVAVAVRPSAAEPVTLIFQAEGQALPDRDTAIRAEASGDVAEVLVSKGQDVEGGEVLARLSTVRAEADLARAREELARARREAENAAQLLERGVATADRVSEANAELAAAEAGVTAAEEAVADAIIVAPFAGRIETLGLDEGEFVQAGTEVGRIVDNDPLTVALQVPQQSLGRISNGQPAQVAFITGETAQGEVAFVGTAAAAETRTFLVEVTVDNPDGAIPAGISAEIRIPTGETLAHFVQPSLVSLDPEGRIGVKTVEDGVVTFHEIEIVRAEIDGIWVTGLPPEAQMITVGQGYVREGDPVTASPEVEVEG
ncbi:efflux RND transporter periplasmic adaptor subunit [Jannaschia formosa]|uniref:efflux RND transporter periplasmic adaptor subunit n=1 Tax=Jannaschia formosa TaxID=2259592 RepID=UPI000E1B94B4|nr:efflux RND transporter periplasmic adaptor subunit [Jannaschia formosa]TFL18337.1 efflux RND transporter periplasmic adaptor subunit [Jannaschia formosa]